MISHANQPNTQPTHHGKITLPPSTRPQPSTLVSVGQEAFDKAKRENKPVLVSIGYATCHWCHVMAHESFEDQQVADILNEHFISIKVDREERPDIDSMYMSVCQMMTGQGGWPLNVFVTPDQKPFYAGTYFPKEVLTAVLASLKH